MIWVAWRQHRWQIAVAALVTIAFGVVLLASGLPLRDAVSRLDTACRNGTDSGATCAGLLGTIQAQFGPTAWLVMIAGSVLPALIAAFLGGPLVAREYEQGTHRLAWTQSIGRERWLIVKVLVVGTAVTVLAVATALLVGWWRSPLDALDHTPWAAYDAEAVVPIATTVFVFVLAIAVGLVVRRSIAAIAIAMAVVAGLKWLLLSYVRPYLFAAPVTANWPPGAQAPVATVPGWYFDLYPVSAVGSRLSSAELVAVVQATGAGDPTTGMRLAGVTWTQVYQPADRFWSFQAVESAILLAAMIALFAFATAWIARRT
jgi:hypothetical protein